MLLSHLQIQAGSVTKDYVALVKGVFPSGDVSDILVGIVSTMKHWTTSSNLFQVEVNAAVAYDSTLGMSRVEPVSDSVCAKSGGSPSLPMTGEVSGRILHQQPQVSKETCFIHIFQEPLKKRAKLDPKMRDSHDAPKSACTRFRLLSTHNGDSDNDKSITSVVQCMPITGRTHQVSLSAL